MDEYEFGGCKLAAVSKRGRKFEAASMVHKKLGDIFFGMY